MIIYSNSIKKFSEDVFHGIIAQKLENLFVKYNIGKESIGEYRAWMQSLRVMDNILSHSSIDKNVLVAIEYQIPLTSKRVDFLISGLDDKNSENVVAIELKQWEKAEKTSLENVVRTYVGNGIKSVPHPSQQVLSYCQLISNFNLSIQERNINLIPCAFLHNYQKQYVCQLEDDAYKEVISKAPLFYGTDGEKILKFISKYIAKPATRNLFEIIDNGKLKPSKALQDSILDLINGNDAFKMIDEQQVAYATIMKILKSNLADKQKYTVIVEGGPGTGKSVIAVQLLANLIKQNYSAAYVTKNAAPREVFSQRLLEGHKTLKYIKGLFKSPVGFEHSSMVDAFDCLLIDEAHRLTKRYGNDQIEDLIKVSRVNVFFLDEEQRVTTKDLGTKEKIIAIAKKYNSRVITDDSLKLSSQFRCNGSDGYIAFLNNVLGIRKTCNTSLFGLDYDFRVYDNPCKMRDDLRELNKINNKARMLAGYCYEWVSEKEHFDEIYDIKLSNGFRAQWNFKDMKDFAINPNSFEQVGCIHTSQGLEFDYVGVIIGFDLRYVNGQVITDQNAIARSDKSSGIRSCKDPKIADELIRNTYKTLMSRGQKGCFVYCQDKDLANYFREVISKSYNN